MAAHGKPNPVVDVIANALGALRADDDMRALARAREDLEPKAIEKLTVEEARRQPTIADAVKRLLQKQGRPGDAAQRVPGVTRTRLSIPLSTHLLSALMYKPGDVANPPVIVYFHGGGWVIADAEAYDGGARGLCGEARAIVVSVAYRQAPEYKFPTAWEDALEVYRWVSANAGQLGGDPTRIALAGESAGGSLALATAVAARSAGLARPRHVLAVYPIAQTGSMHTESYLENAIAKPLNRAMVGWFVSHLVRDDADRRDPRLDLVNADLAGLPPVTIINAALDPLCGDGAQLEDALEAASVPVERKVYTGVAHEFFGCAAVVRKARHAQAYAGARLRASFDF